MKTYAGIAIAILAQFAFLALGHEDPEGDHEPNLKCTDSGFRLLFNRSVPGKPHDVKIERIYDPSFGVLEERQLSEADSSDDTQSYRRWQILYRGSWYFLEKAIGHRPWITAYRPDGKIDILRPKWPVSVGYTAGFSITEGTLVIACNEIGSEDEDPFGFPPEDEGDLMMFAFSLNDLSHIGTLRLGRPSRIYSFPVSSEIVSDKSTFYCGWVRHNPREPKKWQHDLVVSEWNPGASMHKHHVIEDYTSWNGGLSIDAYSNRVYLAYQHQEGPSEKASIQIRKLPMNERDEQAEALKP